MEALVDGIGFQSENTIVTQIIDQLRADMGSTNPQIDEELPVDTPPPAEPEQHVAFATQGNTTNTLSENMMANMKLMRVHLE